MNRSTPGLPVHHQLLEFFKLTSIELVMPSSHLILCCPLLFLPQSLPASESFPMSQLFAWDGQSTGVSALASFLPKNTQGWSLEWTGWISLQSKGLSRVFSNNTVQKHQLFGAQPSSQSNSRIYPFIYHLWCKYVLYIYCFFLAFHMFYAIYKFKILFTYPFPKIKLSNSFPTSLKQNPVEIPIGMVLHLKIDIFIK